MVEHMGMAYYLMHTPKEVGITVDRAFLNKTAKAPTPAEYTKNLIRSLDECNNDRTANPMDWKAGGTIDVDGWSYSIAPQGVRPKPAPQTPQLWCRFENCKKGSMKSCIARLWGAGGLDTGFGHELHEAFDALAHEQDKKDALPKKGKNNEV